MQTRLVARVPFTAETSILPSSLETQIVAPRTSLPSLGIHYPRVGVNAPLLEGIAEVGFEIHDGNGWVEPPNCRFLSSKDALDHLEKTPTVKYQLIGFGYMLSTATAVIPAGRPVDADGKQQFNSSNAGQIMDTLIADAKARGFLKGVEVDFSATQDSAGQAWAKIITIAYEDTVDLETVLTNLADQGLVDYQWQGRTLQLFNPDTALAPDLSDTVRLVTALGQTGAPVERTLESLASDVRVKGEDGKQWTFTNEIPPTVLGRIERVVEQGGVSDPATAELMASSLLIEGGAVRESFTREFEGTAGKLPFRDFQAGAWLAVQKSTEFLNLRAQSISLTVRGTSFKGHVLLGDKIEDLLARLAKRTKGITGGASVGGSGVRPAPEGPDVRIPTEPTGMVIQPSAYIDGNGNQWGRLTIDWAHDGRATDGTTIEVDRYEIRIGVSYSYVYHLSRTTDGGQTELVVDRLAVKKANGSPEFHAVKVRAVAKNGRAGGFTTPIDVEMVSDTTPPPIPSAALPTVLRAVFTIPWDGKGAQGEAMPADFDHTVLQMSATATGPWSDIDVATGATGFTVADQGYETRWFRFITVDRAGNRSDPGASGSATATPLVEEPDIAGAIDDLDSATAAAQQQADQAVADAGAADSKAGTAQLAADQAQQDATQALTDASTADQAAATAKQAADAAQADADAAKADAIAAATAAANAQETADAAGRVWPQDTAPPGDEKDLWIDTSLDASGNPKNTPMRWDGQYWQPVTDQAALDAAAAAAAAQQKADQAFADAATADQAAATAQQKADQAFADAATADGKAAAAQTAADTAQSAAEAAQSAADTAASKADTAQAAADDAQADATTAQAAADEAAARAAAVAAQGINVLSNPSFEFELTDWDQLGSPNNIEIVEGVSRGSGTRAIKTFGEARFGQGPFDAPPGDTLRLTLWYKTDPDYTPFASNTIGFIPGPDQTTAWMSPIRDFPLNEEWAKRTTEWTVPDTYDRDTAYIRVGIGGSSAGAFYLDDLRVENVTAEKAALADAAAAQSTADTAKANAATAQAAADAADAAAATAQAKADKAEADALTADGKAAAAQTAADTADGKAAAAQTAADDAASAAVAADNKAAAARGVADQAVLDADAAADAAAAAQSAADTAQGAADSAASDAAAAAGIAEGKGEVIFDPSEPPVEKRLPQNLWVDTDEGNTPKRWDGLAWTAVTDKVAIDAANAAAAAQDAADAAQGAADTAKSDAATADGKADAAQQAADAAQTAADNAQTKANSAYTEATSAATAAGNAQSTADGKNTTWYSTPPSPYQGVIGDIHFAADNEVKIWTGTAWVSRRDAQIGVVDEKVIEARGVADQAVADAAAAQSKANAADAAADAAQAQADTATTNASTAQSAADAAKAAAAAAQSDADAAQARADAAVADAATAQSAADAADAAAAAADAKAAKAEQDARLAAQQGENRIPNGGFEEDFALFSPGSAVIDTTVFRTGAKSARVDAVSNNSLLPAEPIKVEAGQKWRFQVWAKTTADYNGTASWGKLRLHSDANSFITAKTIPNTADWTLTRIDYTVPEGTSVLTIQIGADHTAGQVWYDDFSAKDVTEVLRLEAEAAAAQKAADDADAAAAAAQSKADAADAAAATAKTAADTADGKAVTAQNTADTASSAASAAQSTADTAKTNAATAQSKADKAEADAATAKGVADTAKANAATAQAAAEAAQATADTAVTNAQTANNAAAAAQSDADTAIGDAAAAAGIAEGKADVLIQSTAPDATMQKATTLWIDTTGGENKPKRWNGTIWDIVTDKTATDAASAAAAAQSDADAAASAAVTAQNTADSANTAAGNANNAAAAAQADADAAASAASAAQSTADTAKTNAATAQSAAEAAQGAANTAQSAADDAHAAATEAAKGAESKVVNGGFERDFENWTKSSSNHGIDETVARTGTKSYWTAGSGEIRQPGFPVVEGQTWRYEWWYMAEATYTAGSPGGLRLQKSTDGGVTFSDAASTGLSAQAEWTLQRVDYIVPAGVTHLRARIAFAYSGGAKAWMDDIRLTDVSQVKALEAQAAAAQDAADAADAAAAAAQSTANTAKSDAATAQSAADAAASAATAAQTAADNAQGTADTALASANGKNKIKYSTEPASGTVDPDDGKPYIKGDVWWRLSGEDVLGQWSFTGSAWVVRQIRSETIAQLDVAKLTGKLGTFDIFETGSLTAESGVIASLDLGKATVGELDGVRIKSGSVGTKSLLVSDFTNLLDNPNFEEGKAGWSSMGYVVPITDHPLKGDGFALEMTGNGTIWDVNNQVIPVEPGESFYATGYVRRVSGTSAGGVQIATTVNRTTGPTWPAFDSRDATTLPIGEWVKLAGEVEIPADGYNIAFRASIRNQVTDGVYQFTALSMRRMNKGELIVDGTLKGTHMDADTIGVREIKTNELEADEAFVGNMRAGILTLGSVPKSAIGYVSIEEYLRDPKWLNPERPFNFTTMMQFTDANGLNLADYDYVETAPGEPGWHWDANAANLRFDQTDQLIYVGEGGVGPEWQLFPVADYITIEPGERYYLGIDTYQGSANFHVGLAMIMFDKDGNRVLNSGPEYYAKTSSSVANDRDREWESHEHVFTVPSGAVSGLPVIEAWNRRTEAVTSTGETVVGASGYVMIGAMSFRRALSGTGSRQHAELSPAGIQLFDIEGNPVVSMTSIPPQYMGILDSAGNTLASMSSDGSIAGENLNVRNDPTILGYPLFGDTSSETFASPGSASGFLDNVPRGIVTRGYRAMNVAPSATNQEREILELSYMRYPKRAYKIHVTPVAGYLSDGAYGYLKCYYTTDGSRPRMNDANLLQVKTIRAGELPSNNEMFDFGTTWYDLADSHLNPHRRRYLFTYEALNGDLTWFGNGRDGSQFRVWVEDIGLDIYETGVDRTGYRGNGGSTPSAPTTAPEKENYVTTWTANGSRSYYTSGGQYTYNPSKMYQGNSPAVGGLRSVATFDDMTGTLSGAEITGVRAYFYFNHWYYNGGGTAKIYLHNDAGGANSTLADMTYAATSDDWPKPGGRWVNIPSSLWAGIKSGQYKGVGLGDESPSIAEYGYANGTSTKIEVKYRK